MTMGKITEISCDCGKCDCTFRGTADMSMAETRSAARDAGWSEISGTDPAASIEFHCPDECYPTHVSL